MGENETQEARFEHALQLLELFDDFLKLYDAHGNMNQPTLLDFISYLHEETRDLASKLGIELDESAEPQP